MLNFIVKTTLAAAATMLLATPVLATGGKAAVQDDVPTEKVSFGDLDLSQPAGRTQFNRRIHLAVDRVCHRGDARDLHAQMLATQCRRDALARTDVQVAQAIQHFGAHDRSVAMTQMVYDPSNF